MNDIQHILASHNLKENHIYLLELIPLIEMIWADGKNQDPEIKVLYQFTIEHLAHLSKDAENVEIISEQEVNEFIDLFIHTRTDPELLRELRELCITKIDRKSCDQPSVNYSIVL